MSWRGYMNNQTSFNWNSPASVIKFPNKLKNNKEPFTFNSFRNGVNYIEVNEGNHKFYYNKNGFKQWYENQGTNPATRRKVTNFRIVKFGKNSSNGNQAARQAAAQRKRNKLTRAVGLTWRNKAMESKHRRTLLEQNAQRMQRWKEQENRRRDKNLLIKLRYELNKPNSRAGRLVRSAAEKAFGRNVVMRGTHKTSAYWFNQLYRVAPHLIIPIALAVVGHEKYGHVQQYGFWRGMFSPI